MTTTLSYFFITIQNKSIILPVFFLSLSHSIITTFTLAQISEIIPSEKAGLGFGFIEILDAIANLVGNILFGLIGKYTGDYEDGIICICVGSFLGFLLLFIFLIFSPQFRNWISSFHPDNYQMIN